jgi:hypothetical protein
MAKLEDERTESAAVKEREAVIGKDAAVLTNPSGVVNIKACTAPALDEAFLG